MQRLDTEQGGMRMREMRRVGIMAECFLMALILGVLFAGPGYASEKAEGGKASKVPDYRYELAKVGTYKGDESSLRFIYGAAIVEREDGYQIVGKDGKLFLDGQVFADYDYWGNGVYVVTAQGGDVNSKGLISVGDGKTLPCEAGMITSLMDNSHDREYSRFVEVIYAEGETEDKSEAFFYTHESDGLINVSFGPSEGDKLYKGYARIYDLQTGTFVEGVQLDSPTEAHDFGDSFVIKQGRGATMYDASGKVLWSGEEGVTAYDRCLTWSKDDKRQLIDSKGKGRYVSKESIRPISCGAGWQSGDYATEESAAPHVVIDFDGKKVLSGSYASVFRYCNGLFLAKEKEGDTKCAVVGMDGTSVAETTSSSITAASPGYNCFETEDGFAITKGSKLIAQSEGFPQSSRDLVAEKDGKYLVLNEEKYTLALDSVEALCPGLVKGRDADSVAYGVYDLFTGKRLLKEEYDEIMYADDCVWAYKNGSWTIYDVGLQEK